MNSSETYINFLRDLIYNLKERIETDLDENKSEFESGQKLELQYLIEHIAGQAEVFGISLDEIGFYDYEKYKSKNENGK